MSHHFNYDHNAYPHYGEMFMPVRLAEAWVPYQDYRCFFPLPEGWDKGTIFAELYRPYRRKKR